MGIGDKRRLEPPARGAPRSPVGGAEALREPEGPAVEVTSGGRRPLYSVGYERLEQARFVEAMVEHGVEVVVDVRLNPVSRKPGFSKHRLAAALAQRRVGYLHVRQLGNPPENRPRFRVGDGTEGRRAMAVILHGEAADCLRHVASLAVERTVALLCLEADHRRCHRSVVAEEIMRLEPILELVQLSAAD